MPRVTRDLYCLIFGRKSRFCSFLPEGPKIGCQAAAGAQRQIFKGVTVKILFHESETDLSPRRG
jgi:hypothetical protein